MKKMFLSVCITAFLQSPKSFSQNFILYGDKTFGGTKYDYLANMLLQSNNHLVLAGWSNSLSSGDVTDPLCDSISNQDIWLIDVDASYSIYWNKNIGGNFQEAFPVLIYDDNGNKIFCCRSVSDSSCEKWENNRGGTGSAGDYWICKVDSSGNKIWDKTFGSVHNELYPNIIKIPSGDFLVIGTSADTLANADKTVPNFGQEDFWAVKLDSLGNKIWDKVYGGTLSELWQPALLANADNTFILAGTTKSPVSGNISDTSRGLTDIWIIKIDSAGNKIWDKRYGGSDDDKPICVIHTAGGGYMLCGSTNSPQDGDVSETSRGMSDIWLLKLDSAGNKQWDRRYGGNNNDSGTGIEPAAGGGYWIYGTTRSDSSFEITEPSYGTDDYWILKIDSFGNKLWDKRFGGPGLDNCTSFILMPDSSIFMGGYAAAGISVVKADSGKGFWDYWLVHFKYTDNNTGIHENTNKNNSITTSPNPTNGKFILNSASKTKGDVFIYDAIGKEIYLTQDISLNQFEIDISSFSKGVYFLKVKSGEDYFLKKLVKM